MQCNPTVLLGILNKSLVSEWWHQLCIPLAKQKGTTYIMLYHAAWRRNSEICLEGLHGSWMDVKRNNFKTLKTEPTVLSCKDWKKMENFKFLGGN